MKTQVIKEVVANKIIHYVVDSKTKKVIGKYILSAYVDIYENQKDKPLLTLTVNGMDN